MRMISSSRPVRALLALAAVGGFVLVATTAQANPSFYLGPIFGTATGDEDTLLVADAAQGVVDGDTGKVLARLPDIQDVDPIARGDDEELWAITSGESAGSQLLYRIDDDGDAVRVANLFEFEQTNNPHPAVVESNPFDVEALGRERALVADAAGNTLLKVDEDGEIKLVAVFPDELVSTENVKRLVGCPAGPPEICTLPEMIPTESVPTSVAIGRDGAFYVGELKGFPAPVGESKVWRIERDARKAKCGESPKCKVVLDGLTSIIDLAFGPRGRLYVAQLDDQSFFALELALDGAPIDLGGSVRACNLETKVCRTTVSDEPVLTAITFRDDDLWGATNSFFPGTDVTELDR
jgi:hypothetical protein